MAWPFMITGICAGGMFVQEYAVQEWKEVDSTEDAAMQDLGS